MSGVIPHAVAERLRAMLAMIQTRTYLADEIPMPTRETLVNLIGAEGFALIDELEGVIR